MLVKSLSYVRTWMLSLALLVVVPLGAAAGCSTSAAETPGGSAAARAAVEKGALLLDVRTPAEFASGHLPGAVNIPVDEVSAGRDGIAAGRQVVVYCRSGRRSAIAATALRQRGHEVIDIGTMGGW